METSALTKSTGTPLLSIVIPFYGNANKVLLDRCLASIDRQDLAMNSYEVIIQAKGTYILFIDADDYLFDHSLVKFIQLLEQEQPDMLSFNYKEVTSFIETYNSNIPTHLETYSSGAAYMLTHNFTGTVWRHFYNRKWLLENKLFFKEHTFHEDIFFLCQTYLHAGKTLISNEVIYAYYQQPQSIIHNKQLAFREKRIQDFLLQLIEASDAFHMQQTKLTKMQCDAMQRRLAFFTIDLIIEYRRNCTPLAVIRQQVQALKGVGLLPLPSEKYGIKYKMARFIINSLSLVL